MEAAQHRPDDIFIAAMGLTGAGKSTFIADCTGDVGGVGHGLESCTCPSLRSARLSTKVPQLPLEHPCTLLSTTERQYISLTRLASMMLDVLKRMCSKRLCFGFPLPMQLAYTSMELCTYTPLQLPDGQHRAQKVVRC